MAKSRKAQREAMHTEIRIDSSYRVTKKERKQNGLVPRNYKTHPMGYFCPVYSQVEMPLYPDNEIEDRIRQKDKDQSWLDDIIKRGNYGGPCGNLYQNGYGYCWAYSSGNAQQAMRALMNLPYVKLSAFAVAYLIKGGRDEGGWGALSAEWAMKYGYPSDEMAPNLKKPVKDTPELRADMAKHKIDAVWADLTASAYDRKLSKKQVMTCLLNDCAVIGDFNWWSHSVFVCRLVLTKTKSGVWRVDTKIQNNWDQNGNDNGNTVLEDARAWPDGAVAIRSVSATQAAPKVVAPERLYTPMSV